MTPRQLAMSTCCNFSGGRCAGVTWQAVPAGEGRSYMQPTLLPANKTGACVVQEGPECQHFQRCVLGGVVDSPRRTRMPASRRGQFSGTIGGSGRRFV